MNEREKLFQEAKALGLTEVCESPGDYSDDELRSIIWAERSWSEHEKRILRIEDRISALEEQMRTR